MKWNLRGGWEGVVQQKIESYEKVKLLSNYSGFSMKAFWNKKEKRIENAGASVETLIVIDFAHKICVKVDSLITSGILFSTHFHWKSMFHISKGFNHLMMVEQLNCSILFHASNNHNFPWHDYKYWNYFANQQKTFVKLKQKMTTLQLTVFYCFSIT